MGHPNEEVLRQNYRAAADGDLQAALDRMADDIVWHVGGNSSLSGDFRGKEAVVGYLGRLAEETDGTLKNQPHDVLANDEHGVGLLEFTAKRGEKSLNIRAAHIVHFRDGKLAEVWMFLDDQEQFDEFLA